MENIEKLLDDSREEKITIANPVEIWADLFLDELNYSKEDTIRITSRELYDRYIAWAEELREPSYLYNHIQFMVRFSALKLKGVKCGLDVKIKGRTIKCCIFDIEQIKKSTNK